MLDVPAVLCSHLRRSHTMLGGGKGKWALWQFCPATEESLKNALDYDSRLVHHLQENHLAYVSLYKK